MLDIVSLSAALLHCSQSSSCRERCTALAGLARCRLAGVLGFIPYVGSILGRWLQEEPKPQREAVYGHRSIRHAEVLHVEIAMAKKK